MIENKEIIIERIQIRRDAQIGVRIPSSVKSALEKIAKEKGLGLSDYINLLAIREIERHGFDVTLKAKLTK